MNLEKVRFPLDLKRRHDDLVLERNKRRRKDALRGAASSIKKDAKELENQFHIENIYKKIRKIYGVRWSGIHHSGTGWSKGHFGRKQIS